MGKGGKLKELWQGKPLEPGKELILLWLLSFPALLLQLCPQ